MKIHTLILSGNGSYSNKGCEAIVRGTTSLLRDQLGECNFVSNYFPTSGSRDEEHEIDSTILHRPFPILKRYSLPWIEEQISRKIFHKPNNIRRVAKVFHQSLRESEAVLMLGGDNFSLDYPDSNVHFSLCHFAEKANVPVAIWGASIGPFTRAPHYEQWAAKELSKVNLICARETATVEYLANIGVTRNVMLTADPSFFLQPSECQLSVEIEKSLNEGCIGLNLSPLLSRFVKISESGPNLSTWTKVAVEIVQNLLRHFSVPILMIPHVTSEVGEISRDDYLFMSKVAQIINNPERVLVLSPNYNAGQTKYVIGRLLAFAGARTHSTLAAISSCVPTICIGYSMKAKGIAQDIYGNLDWLISGQDLVNDPTELRNRFSSLVSKSTETQNQLKQIRPIMEQRARTAAEKVASIIKTRETVVY